MSKFWEKYFYSVHAFIIAGAGALYACLIRQHRIGFLNDDAIYAIVARDFWNASASHPLLGIKPDYPLPGLPMLLAPLANLIDPHWSWLNWASAVATLAAIFLLGKLAKKWLSAGDTLLAVALYAFNPVVARVSGVLMPAPYYTMAVMGSFLLMRETLENPARWKTVALGFILGWAGLLRPEGALLLLSIGVPLVLTPEGRKVLRGMAAPLAGWLVFFALWFYFHRTPATEFGGDAAGLASYWLSQPLSIIGVFAKMTRVFLLNTLAAGTFSVGFLCLIGIISGYRSVWRQYSRDRQVMLAIGIFFGAHFLAHVFWRVGELRYFVPLLPLAFIFLAKWPSKWLKPFVALLFLSYIHLNGYAVHEALVMRDPMKAPPRKALRWLRHNTPASAQVISNIAPSIDLYTGRSAGGAIEAKNVDLFFYLVSKTGRDYIVIRDGELVTPGVKGTDDPNIMWSRCRRWVRLYPQRFPQVFYDPVEKTGIYKVVSDPDFMAAFESFIGAVQNYEAGRYELAFEKVSWCLSVYPGLGCAANFLGVLYLIQNNPVSAERAFMRALEYLPDSSNSSKNLATLYHRQGRAALALEYIDKGLGISTANGNQAKFTQDIKRLRELWSAGRAQLFIDSPPPSAYRENAR